MDYEPVLKIVRHGACTGHEPRRGPNSAPPRSPRVDALQTRSGFDLGGFMRSPIIAATAVALLAFGSPPVLAQGLGGADGSGGFGSGEGPGNSGNAPGRSGEGGFGGGPGNAGA